MYVIVAAVTCMYLDRHTTLVCFFLIPVTVRASVYFVLPVILTFIALIVVKLLEVLQYTEELSERKSSGNYL